VLRALVERAQTAGHLRHTHRLILLYTLGRLGLEGQSLIHRTLAHCRNYNASVSQRYIDGLDPNYPPITCRRIREWLEEEGESITCQCGHSVRSPIDLVVPETQTTGTSPRKRKSGKPRACQWSDEDAELLHNVMADVLEAVNSDESEADTPT